MSQSCPWILHRIGVTGGTYRGLLSGGDGADAPVLTMQLDGADLGPVSVTAIDGGGWTVEGEMGLAPLTDGTQTVFLRLPDGTALDSVTVVTGLSAPEDLRAQVEVLEAELDLLKTAFRRHVNESRAGSGG